MRAIATPRINRLAGRNDQAAIVQTMVCEEVSVAAGSPDVPRVITVGIRNGSRKPIARLSRESRSSRLITSPPAEGSNVGRLTQTLKALPEDGQPASFSTTTKTASDKTEMKYAVPAAVRSASTCAEVASSDSMKVAMRIGE